MSVKTKTAGSSLALDKKNNDIDAASELDKKFDIYAASAHKK